MRSHQITALKKQYPREWLLIRVETTDPATTTPLTGQLLAHSPHREDVYRRLLHSPKTARKLLVEYSEDSFPKGYAAAF